jgi:hypothetical protein
MNARFVPACLCWLLAISEPISAQNLALAEKVRDVSPDKKFALQISYDAAMCQQMFPDAGKTSSTLQRNIQEEYFSDTIKSIELVSLPKKVVVADLPWDGSANQTRLIWSRDSKWCAFYAETPRWGLTWVYHLRGDKFVRPGVESKGDAHQTWEAPLEIEMEGDVRREWLNPIRWVKPGVLLLEQSIIFRNADTDEATYRPSEFDEKTGNLHIVSKKKLPSKE